MNIDPVQHLSRFERPSTRPRAPGEPRSERDEVLSRFHARGSIMVKDAKKGLRRATEGEIALLTAKAGYRTAEQLYRLYRDCEGADSFSKLFWYKVKPKPVWKT